MHAVNWLQISPLSCADWQAALRSQSLLWEKWQKSLINSRQTVDYNPLLTYVGVAEGVLRVRQSARTALRQLLNVQAAEDKQQADQVLVQWLHFSKLCPLLSAAGINRMESSWIRSESPAAVMSKSRVVVAGACRLARSATPWCWRGAQPYI